MGCALGIGAALCTLIGLIFHLPSLLVIGGMLQIVVDIYGLISGQLRGIASSIIGYSIGLSICIPILINAGYSLFSALMGGIGIVGIVFQLGGILLMLFVSRK